METTVPGTILTWQVKDVLDQSMSCGISDDKAKQVRFLEQEIGKISKSIVMPVSSYLFQQIGSVTSADRLKSSATILHPEKTGKSGIQYLPNCNSIGLPESVILDPFYWKADKLPLKDLTNGVVYELVIYLKTYTKGEAVDLFHACITSVFQAPVTVSPKRLWMKACRTHNGYKKHLKHNRSPELLQNFAKECFLFPDAACSQTESASCSILQGCSFPASDAILASQNDDVTADFDETISSRLSSLQDSETESSRLHLVQLLSDKKELQRENQSLRDALRQMEADSHVSRSRDSSVTLQEHLAKHRRSLRHFRKQASVKTAAISTLKGKVVTLKLKVRQLQGEKKSEQSLRRKAVEQRDKALHLKHNLESKVSYYKGKANINQKSSLFNRKVKELTDELNWWQDRCTQLEDKMQAFLSDAEVTTFKDGRYTDAVREVYMELMCLRVGAKNVEPIVRNVLKNLSGADVGRLPGPTFAKYMLLEARNLAYQHLSEVTAEEKGNLTAGSDGTTKYGHHYGSVQLSFTDDRPDMVGGLRDMATGDAEAYLQVLQEIVEDVSSCYDKDESVYQVIAKMKNTISDQASVNKKLNVLIQQWRSEALPHVIEGWCQMNDVEKGKHIKLNIHWCGLHFVVGLCEQANKTLALWENLVHRDVVVGAPSLPGGYCQQGESGTTRLVRTVCKALQDRGCQKSGKPVLFRDFLADHAGIKSVPLYSFVGSRINILPVNAAGTVYLWHHLCTFVEQHKDDNRLFQAIFADLQVVTYLAGARALGLISKFVTEPLWRELSKDGPCWDMTPLYKKLVLCFSEMSNDATLFLAGNNSPFSEDLIHRNHVLDSLVQPDPRTDELTKQALELLFSSFLVVCQRQLKDHLDDGVHANWDETMKEEARSVPKTNVGPERIFSSLDHLLAIMPSASTIAMEGITMWSHNHTAIWLDSLGQGKKKEVMEKARKSVSFQRVKYLEKQVSIRQKRHEVQASKLEVKALKEQKQRVQKEKLTAELQRLGGLWEKADDVDAKMNELSGLGARQKRLVENEVRQVIEAQIRFRRFVLGAKNTNNIMCLSSGKRKLSLDSLAANLKAVIRTAEDEASSTATFENQVRQFEFVPLELDMLQSQKSHFRDMATAVKAKASAVPDHGSGPPPPKRTRAANPQANIKQVPLVEKADDFLGKRVEYNENGKTKHGIVISVRNQRAGPSSCSVLTDRCKAPVKIVFADPFVLQDCLIKLIPVSFQYLVNKRVEHCFLSSSDGLEYWYSGTVLSFNKETSLHTIKYDMEEDEDEDENAEEDEEEDPQTVYDEPLLQDYLDGDVRLIKSA